MYKMKSDINFSLTHEMLENEENELWQMDMIHIREGSRYDGYFEKIGRASCRERV